MAKKRRLRRVRKRQLAFFRVLFLVVVGAISSFYFLQSSFWSVDTVLVDGNRYIEEEEILQLASIPHELNIFKMDLKRGEERILIHPLVKKVSLSRKLPRTILIDIEERSPVIILPADGSFYEVDEQGVIIRKIAAVSNAKLPLVTGLQMENVELGFQIPPDFLEEALVIIEELPKEILRLVTEINLSQQNTVYLHTLDDILINFGDAQRTKEKAGILKGILETAELQTEKLEYIDLSFVGPPVVKYRK